MPQGTWIGRWLSSISTKRNLPVRVPLLICAHTYPWIFPRTNLKNLLVRVPPQAAHLISSRSITYHDSRVRSKRQPGAVWGVRHPRHFMVGPQSPSAWPGGLRLVNPVNHGWLIGGLSSRHRGLWGGLRQPPVLPVA